MEFDLADGLKWYIVFLFSTCCHEAAHAWAALRLGDDTAHRGGQVTLDPTPHIKRSPMGMVVVPLLSYFTGGWMIGWASAPYNPEWALRYPRRAALMALAGPAANFLLVVAAAFLMRMGFEWGLFHRGGGSGFMHLIAANGDPEGLGAFAAQMLSLLFALNLLLGVFNLIPFPPLDGSNVPLLFLPEKLAGQYWLALRQPMFTWMGLMVSWKLSGAFFPGVFQAAANVLYSIMRAR